jgi:hypothetical protein
VSPINWCWAGLFGASLVFFSLESSAGKQRLCGNDCTHNSVIRFNCSQEFIMKSHQLPDLPNKIISLGFLEKKTLVVLSFYIIFIIFLIIQHAMVFPYHDDWGLAVLDYGIEQTGFSGQNFKFSHALSFLVNLYKNWSGRVFSIFLEIYLLKFGLWYVRLFQILTILTILYYSMRIAIGYDERPKIASAIFILPIILYISLPPEIFMGGIYWFSAASNYLWGVPLFLFAAHSVFANQKITIGSSVMLALSSIFHEQMACAAIAFYLSYIMYDQLFGSKKQSLLDKFFFLAPTVLLSAATILAPGNFARKKLSVYGSDSLYEIVLKNFTAISEMFISQNSTFFWIFFLSFISLAFSSIKKPIRTASDLLFLGLSGIVLLFSYFLLPHLLFAICFVGLYSFALLRLCRVSKSGMVVFSVFVASLASLAPLLLAPVFYWRSGIPFYLLLFVPILFSMAAIKKEGFKYCMSSVFGVIFILGLFSSISIFNGYKNNYKANIMNHYQLMILSYKINNNMDVDNTVSLFKLPSPKYAEFMPYQRPLIEKWIKKYYQVPQEINFEWH